ncbi:hypothetical protein COT98_03935 [Candidatus Falkowbacteria bacterium CG10_big_fil_rev_8_21_14_0_10_39_9]|uniref:Uncharacterized protein n=1 Tax=Candidatus Falkowbacteria bacterium CG10_big_fil_rev_8_21_14_0_10_39_9 TaxID=1974566 RepID=A0A2M6WNK2_9BACT|nr:MAG: hypothetical protein COT98_03935 [Candidatus Falkowbacteria bacterium CG10_big_fil_rev_8_21_14_0_10_39_9]
MKAIVSFIWLMVLMWPLSAQTLLEPIKVANTAAAEYSPVLVGARLYFTSDRENSSTSLPELLQKENLWLVNDSGRVRKNYFFNNDDNTAIAGSSADGRFIFIYKSFFPDNGELFLLDSASHLRILPAPINSGSDENSATFDGHQLIFTSDRDGSLGQHDIYLSNFSDGKFSPPENIKILNTVGDEHSVFLKGDSLFFSSDGLGTGGYDVFLSIYNSSTWSKPQPVKEVNTIYNEIDYRIYQGKKFFASDRSGNYDLYRLSEVKKIVSKKTDTVQITKLDTLITKLDPEKIILEKIKAVLDSIGFKIEYYYVQVGAYHTIGSLAQFKIRLTQFKDCDVILEEQRKVLNPNSVLVKPKDPTLKKFLWNQKFFDLQPAATLQGKVINEYLVDDSFIAGYNQDDVRIFIYVNVKENVYYVVSPQGERIDIK